MQLAAAGAVVTALDRSEARLKRLHRNLARVGLEAEVAAFPAEDWLDSRTYDAVLLDAPCTATGYCVCSLEREEGETQIIAFLRRNPAFRTVPAVPADVGAPDEALTAEGWLRILPSMWAERGGVDGFFAAKLERV